MVNVIVLFSKIEEGKSIKNLLVRNGISVSIVCTTGAQAAQAVDDLDDGLIVCGYRYQDMLFSDLKNDLPDYIDMVVVTSKSNYSQCQESEVVCLTMPIKAQDFVNTINGMIDNILWQRKRRKNKPKQRSEEEKRIIKTAKNKLISERGITEEEAHRYLQKKSMDSGISLIDMAYMILDAVI